MSFSGIGPIPKLVVAVVGGFGDFCRAVMAAFAGAGAQRPDGDDSRREFQAEIWKLRRLLHTTLGQGVGQEIVGAIGWLARNGDRVERAVVAWVDLIEALVQAEERRYGSRPGLGKFKKDDIKQVIRGLLAKEHIRIPHVAESLVPVFLDLFVDWAVDAVVLMANRHGMWEVGGEPHRRKRVFWAAIRRGLRAFFRPVWVTILGTAIRIATLFRRITPLPPELADALNAVQRDGFIVDASDLIAGAEKALVWISGHRVQLVAAFELVLAAVQEAEAYLELPGPEKKEYAQNLILAVLDELGFEERTGLMFAIVNSLIGSSIEATVRLFNKRGVFLHRGVAAT
jgi:hypothetical protein